MLITPSALLSSFSYIVELLPFHLLAYYPFRGQFRFPLWAVVFINAVLMSVQCLGYVYLYGIGADARPFDISVALIFMVTYMSCVKTNIPKLLFIYTLIVDYIMIARGTGIFLEICFFTEPGEPLHLLGAPSVTISRMVPTVVTSPFMLSFLNITKERVLHSHAPKLWRTIWMIPALTSFIVLIFTYNLNVISVARLAFLLARVCLLIMVLIVYYLLVSSLESLKLQGEAEERARNQEQIMAMQRAQYSMLQKQIEATRHARHDLRQHYNVIQGCLECGDVELLKDYIAKYGQKLSALTPKTYCSNYAVDAVVRHYAEMAAERHIRFDSHILLPQQLSIHEPDICILFGNLLENAVEACARMPGASAFIRIHAKAAGEQAISITVDNSCPGAPAMKDGYFLSSRHPGNGTGTASVRNIALQYHGIADFKYESGVFYASVFLNPGVTEAEME